MCNVLSLDGGGVRGLISLLILQNIVEIASLKLNRPVEVVDLFDFYSGSSIGTVIISGLLTRSKKDPTRPEYLIGDLIAKIEQDATSMFERTWKEDWYTMWGYTAPLYNNNRRDLAFQAMFQDLTMGDLLKPVVFPCGDLLLGKPVYIDNSVDLYKPLLVRDVLLGTTAAPTYFPSKIMKIGERQYNLVDSGCVVNETTELAYLEASKHCPGQTVYEVSIGTGLCPMVNVQSGGMLAWARQITYSFMKFSNQNEAYELSLMTPAVNYDRLNPPIPSQYNALDLPQYIPQYKAITLQWLTENKVLMESVVDKLLTNHKLSTHNN